MDKKYLAYGSSSLAALIGGSSFIFAKMIMTAGLAWSGMLFWRMLFAVIVMLLLYAAGLFPLHLRGKPVLKAALVSLFYPGCGLLLEMLALNFTTAAEVSAMMAMVPVAVMLCSRLLFRERQTGRQRAAVLLSVAGVLVIVFAEPFRFSLSYVGYLILLLAVCCDCGYNLSVKWLTGSFTNTEISLINTVVALILYTLVAAVRYGGRGQLGVLLAAPFADQSILIGLLFLGIANSVLVSFMNNFSIRHIGPTRHSSFLGLVTLTTVIMSRWVLYESIMPLKYLGMALIVAGAWGANHFRAPEPEAELSADGGRCA